MTRPGGLAVAPAAGRSNHERHHTLAEAGPDPALLPGLLGGAARRRARWSSTLLAVLALVSAWRGDQERKALDGGPPMIYLSGHEHIPVAPGRAPARLFDLSRVEVLGAANLAARAGRREMADALYRWQYRLLKRELAAPGGDGGNAA